MDVLDVNSDVVTPNTPIVQRPAQSQKKPTTAPMASSSTSPTPRREAGVPPVGPLPLVLSGAVAEAERMPCAFMWAIMARVAMSLLAPQGWPHYLQTHWPFSLTRRFTGFTVRCSFS